MQLLSVTNCIHNLLAQARPTQTIHCLPIIDANRHILAEDIIAPVDVPPADNSAMDGYAINSNDLPDTLSTTQTKRLTISQRIPAGTVPQPLEKRTAARIFTGAQIPEGADTVVIQENCTEQGDTVEFQHAAQPAANIRPQGQDIRKGNLILAKGTPLSAAQIGLLASIGIAEVNVYEPLTIAIINTGDELVEPGTPLKSGQIYNSNRFLLDSMLKSWGFKTRHSDITQDSLSATQTALATLSQQSDIVITTGGVSVGETDFVKPAVEALGTLSVWKVAIKPGKPFAFGQIQQTPFLGLPGNPASVFVTLAILAKPFLLAQQGVATTALKPTVVHAKANFSRKAVRREEYLRARYQGGHVDLHPNQSSGVLSSTSWGNCLVRQAVDQSINAGDDVDVIFY